MYDTPNWQTHATRAADLDGRAVIARPQGPMGPTIAGVANGYDNDRPDPVVYVEQADGTQEECWVWDVEEDPDSTGMEAPTNCCSTRPLLRVARLEDGTRTRVCGDPRHDDACAAHDAARSTEGTMAAELRAMTR